MRYTDEGASTRLLTGSNGLTPFVPFLLWRFMSSVEMTEWCKWTVVRIDGAYLVLGELAYPAKQNLASMPPFQNCAMDPSGQEFYTGTYTVVITRDEGNGALILAWQLQNSN